MNNKAIAFFNKIVLKDYRYHLALLYLHYENNENCFEFVNMHALVTYYVTIYHYFVFT